MITRYSFLSAIVVISAGCAGLTFAGAANAIDQRDWGKKYATSERFVVLGQFGKQAVLDKETQLVWQRTPAPLVATNWAAARTYCFNLALGGRLGWRLPNVHELNSLLEPAAAGQLALPSGHPFQSVPLGIYWTTSRQFNGTDSAPTFTMTVDVTGGGLVWAHVPSTSGLRSWCVRGESQASEH